MRANSWSDPAPADGLVVSCRERGHVITVRYYYRAGRAPQSPDGRIRRFPRRVNIPQNIIVPEHL